MASPKQITSDSKILIVDDFEMIRMLISKELQKLSFNNFHEACDGQEALEKLEEANKENEPYNLIFCDWTMPNMDGLELLKVCKEREDLQDIPFVMLTAESEKKNVIKAISMGLISYIVKPLNPGTLAKKIEAINAQLAKE